MAGPLGGFRHRTFPYCNALHWCDCGLRVFAGPSGESCERVQCQGVVSAVPEFGGDKLVNFLGVFDGHGVQVRMSY